MLIENNFIYDNGKRGINLSSNGNTSNHIGSSIIRFNTIITNDQSSVAMNTVLSNVSYELTGNIFVRTDGGSTYVFTEHPYTDEANIMVNSDVGFVDFSNRDLHLSTSSSALNFASGIIDFPEIDFDGETRISANLDAGADER